MSSNNSLSYCRAIGIFGQELNLTLRFHSRLSFLWEWLKHADELHEPNEDYSWENFLLLKSSLDKSPNEVIEYADAQELISPIIRAFFKELAEPFFPTFSTRNVNNLPKCTYYSISKQSSVDSDTV